MAHLNLEGQIPHCFTCGLSQLSRYGAPCLRVNSGKHTAGGLVAAAGRELAAAAADGRADRGGVPAGSHLHRQSPGRAQRRHRRCQPGTPRCATFLYTQSCNPFVEVIYLTYEICQICLEAFVVFFTADAEILCRYALLEKSTACSFCIHLDNKAALTNMLSG